MGRFTKLLSYASSIDEVIINKKTLKHANTLYLTISTIFYKYIQNISLLALPYY